MARLKSNPPTITPPPLKPAGILLGLDIPTPPNLTAQREAPSLASPELAYLGLFDLIVEEASLPAAWQAERTP